MRLLLSALGFIAGFSLEVRVDAAERVRLREVNVLEERLRPHSAAVIEEPRLCLTNGGLCAVRVGADRMLTLKPGGNREWTLTEKSIAIRRSENQVRLVEGSLRVRGSKNTVETEHGILSAEDEVHIDRYGEDLTIINTGRFPALLKGLGWAREEAIPSGMQVTLSRPSLISGKTSVGLPLPLDFESQVIREARIFSGKKADFPEKLEDLLELRSFAAAQAAKLHREAVERKIASVQAENRKLKRSQALREARDQELRALFRKKTLGVN